MMGLWGRSECPSASSLSRFLAAVGSAAAEGLQFMQERTEEAKPRESVPPLGEPVATGEASAGEPAAPNTYCRKCSF